MIDIGKVPLLAGTMAAALAALATTADGAPLADPPAALAAATAHELEVGEATALTQAEGFVEPSWSPDGSALSFAGEGARGIYTVDLRGGPVREIASPEDVAVFRHRWSDGNTILVPRRGEAEPLDVAVSTGATRPSRAEPRVWIERDDVVVSTEDGPRWLTRGQDRFLDPVLSPDGTRVAFVGLATGLHVARLDTGAVRHLGAGTRPCWTPSGDHVVFERTDDDGEEIVGSELWAWSVAGGDAYPLTATPDATERYPAVSPDGTALAFVRDGAVVVAPLTRRTP